MRAAGPPGSAGAAGLLVLSQHVERLYARELLADGDGGVGYLLKDRVFDAEQFVGAVRRGRRAPAPWTRR
ncbi:hypothetical protein GCM10023084_00770 [Streptomyces lacrimifluminis]|uniref:Uncharacterized protein n=1 Tax=Streptomyces lacrimifluminis TaxID=1500077 RepID=A0A917NR54_9ACTN|nr:hypothetical protein GCM10012282_15850 [Streptomyces lacrimifluminis]